MREEGKRRAEEESRQELRAKDASTMPCATCGDFMYHFWPEMLHCMLGLPAEGPL